MRRLSFLACLAAGLLAVPALAEEPAPAGDEVVVTLTSGATFRGVLVSEDGRTVTIRSSAGTVRSLPRTSVARVERATAAAPQAATAPPAGEATSASTPGIAQAPVAAVAAPVAAPAEAHRVRVGLGVALPSAGDFPSFYVPIQVNPSLRIEPELGLVRASSGGDDATALQVGLGLLGTGAVAPQVGAYGGLRFQLQRVDGSGGGSLTNVRVAAVLGGEWQPVPQVALGVEAQAAYVSVDGAFLEGQTASGFATAGLVFFRVFLD